ncbi:hypothetical protein [uncultured Clostridium sp.]|nr:hypothetical protein [uncultured Clostridium sp.]
MEATSKGEVFWVDKDQLCNLELSEGFLEGFTVYNDNYDSGVKFL